MSKTGAMFLEQQVRNEMAREPDLNGAIERFAEAAFRFKNERDALGEALRRVMRFALPITHHDVEDFNFARDALRKAGLEP